MDTWTEGGSQGGEVVKPETMEMEMETEMKCKLICSAVVARSTSALKVAVPFEFCYRFVY